MLLHRETTQRVQSMLNRVYKLIDDGSEYIIAQDHALGKRTGKSSQ